LGHLTDLSKIAISLNIIVDRQIKPTLCSKAHLQFTQPHPQPKIAKELCCPSAKKERENKKSSSPLPQKLEQ